MGVERAMNCIWITTDSLRQDHISCYRPEGTIDDSGDSLKVSTPNLDRLAKRGVLFERMRSEALPTIPCRRGIFTGRRVFPWREEPFPKGLVVRQPGWRPIPQEDVTIAEHLAKQGYVTALVADTYHLFKPSMNFHRGFHSFHWERGQEFDHWRTAPLPAERLDRHTKPDVKLGARRNRVLTQFLQNHTDPEAEDEYPVARTFTWAMDWLEGNCVHDMFFLYIDTFSPHEPWLTPRRFLEPYDPDASVPDLLYGNPYARSDLSASEHHHLRARYAGACSMVDYWIGRLLETLDRLDLWENTLVILMSDHGKIIGEFGSYGMPPHCTGPALNSVPCLIAHPEGQNAGRRFGGWLYNIDVTATMLTQLGGAGKSDVEGEDVWPAVSAGDQSFRPHLVTAHSKWHAVWEDDWLYLVDSETGRAALYDLASDIQRKHDIAARHQDLCGDFAAKLFSQLSRRDLLS